VRSLHIIVRVNLLGFGAFLVFSRAFLAASATGSPVCCWEEPCAALLPKPAMHRAATIMEA